MAFLMGARQLPVFSRGCQDSVHQEENISLGASAEKHENSTPVSSRKLLIGQCRFACLFLTNHYSLGDGIQQDGAQPCSQRSCPFPRKVVTLQGNSGFRKGNQDRGKNEGQVATKRQMSILQHNLTKNSEMAGGSHAVWRHKEAKPTSILIENKQRMSENEGSINSSLNILFRHMEGASRKNSCESYKEI